jgi:subtilisin family serine protease
MRALKLWSAVALAGLALLAAGSAAVVSGSHVSRATASAKLAEGLDARLAQLDSGHGVNVIVTLRRPATRTAVDKLSTAVGGFSVGRRFTLLPAFSATVTKRQALELSQLPQVARIEPNARVLAANDGARIFTGIDSIRAAAPTLDGDHDGSPSTYSKDDIVAAVLDTGIDASHVDLAGGKVLAFVDCVGQPCTPATPFDSAPTTGHGTHVAATIAGTGAGIPRLHGIAPGAALVGVRTLTETGAGNVADVVTALDWVVQHKADYNIRVVNLSLGIIQDPYCSDGSDAASQAVNAAYDAGLLVVVAAGNSVPGGLTPTECSIKSPGLAAKALTVGNVADPSEGGWYLRYDSGRGPTADGRLKPELVAPGVGITSARAGSGNGYVTLDGTSMSAAVVTGTALLMLDANPSLTNTQIVQTMESTAEDFGAPGPDNDYGWGRIDAYSALRSLGVTGALPPPEPTHLAIHDSMDVQGDVKEYPFDVQTTRYAVAATMEVPGHDKNTKDFDLYLLGPDGAVLSTSHQSGALRQEAVSYWPTVLGTYTVRVVSYYGTGGFDLDISAGTDVTAPALAVPANQTLDADGPTGTVYTFTATATDPDDDAVTVCSPTSGALFPIGTTTVSCKAGDTHGNTSAASFTVTVADKSAPVVTVPTDITTEATEVGGARVTFTVSAADKVDGAITPTCQPASNSLFVVGTTQVTCTAKDRAGNTGTGTFNVTVTAVPPTLTVPAPMTVEATSKTATIVSFTATAKDVGGNTLTPTCTPASGTGFALGTTTVTCKATDSGGRSTTKTFTVTVVDTKPPTITVPAPISRSVSGPSAITYSASASDLVDGTVPVGCVPASGATFPIGTTTVKCTAADAAGNSSTASFTVTLTVTPGPTLTVPAPMTVEATSKTATVVNFTATASDADGHTLTPICTPASGSKLALGTTTVTCKATDSAGRSTTKTFTVTVVDTTPPVITVPAGISRSVPGPKAVTYSASATDLVDGPVPVTCLPASGTKFPIGTTTVSCSAKDASGNSATVTFTVTLVEQLPDLSGLIYMAQMLSNDPKLDAALKHLGHAISHNHKKHACKTLARAETALEAAKKLAPLDRALLQGLLGQIGAALECDD